jgi:hypothetical protein
MDKNIEVRPQSLLSKIGDFLMIPIMYLVAGTLESPQKTHRWNNIKLKPEEVAHLNSEMMVHAAGITTPVKSRGLLFHIPILGGWNEYIVIEPELKIQSWHIGWIAKDTAGISQIPINGPVRMLLGPGEAKFFGVNKEDKKQIPIKKISGGKIGDGGPYKNIPLL